MSLNAAVLSELQCPVCIDILQAPVRILSCGHNFCGKCLREHFASSVNACPICRKRIDEQEVKSLIRNYCVERVLELVPQERTESTNERSNLRAKLSPYSIREIQEIVKHLRKEKNFHAALDFLHILVEQMNDLDQLRPAIETTRCQLALGRVKKAEETCRQKVLPLINSSIFDESFRESYPILDDDLSELLQECKEKREFAKTKLLLSQSLIKVIDVYHKYDSEKHLRKLTNLGGIVKSLEHEKWFNSKKIDLMNQVLVEMQTIEDVNLRKKANIVGAFLFDIGETLGQWSVLNYSQSSALYWQAITLLRTVCGKTAEHQKLLADCYFNLGKIYKKQLAVSKAKKSLKTAIEIYKSAGDLSNKAKEINVGNVCDELNDIEWKLALLRSCILLLLFFLLVAVIIYWFWDVVANIKITESRDIPDNYFP